ncbi:hypothetical protein BIGA_1554 [Bifidobacterium pullorum subsp. gallinarum]|uniref:Ribbon-helix-helix protein CopG domain-containing protein n=2 Tax=Bifidobacterium pullorum TaxID=78448 RepID=A0A087AM86_9BIFI|nr:hypothetical protein BIGA_1554 [Bifidobacterium pullorum subsp. gallinarum]
MRKGRIMAIVTEDGHAVTDAMLDQWADDAERGRYHGTRGDIVVGRPPLSDEELVTLTFKIQPSVLARVDAAARHAGITRSAFLRRAVEHELAVT